MLSEDMIFYDNDYTIYDTQKDTGKITFFTTRCAKKKNDAFAKSASERQRVENSYLCIGVCYV